jgi:hypothetical protein
MGNRPAKVDNTISAKGYCIIDAEVNYTKGKWEAGSSVQNVLKTIWKEIQFTTESCRKTNYSLLKKFILHSAVHSLRRPILP